MISLNKKLLGKIENPKSVGFFTEKEAQARCMRLAVGKEGSIEGGNLIALYLLVDESDGVIADAKFQVFGEPLLIGAAEITCELLLRRNYDQARRISAELIDKQVSFPHEKFSLLNLILFAIEDAAQKCMDIPVADVYVSPPVANSSEATVYPGWEDLDKQRQIEVIESVIADDIRPYIELDAGGVKILDLQHGKELTIAYEGACTTCISSTGSTLSAIQQILRTKIHPQIVVIPEL